jgi:CRP-like cAMP-binding protein
VIKDIGPGQVIFRQRQEGDRAYFVRSGEVEVLRKENGPERLIAKLSKREYF